MSKTRVAIIDDSSVVRQMLTAIVAADPDLEVVASAATAATGIAKVESSKPDVVTLDVELPDRSGLDVLVDLRRMNPRLPIIMFSSLTRRAAATTLDALARGATDYVTKPSDMGSAEAAMENVRTQLCAKIKALTPKRRGLKTPAQTPPLKASIRPPAAPPAIIAIGCSTGGPSALNEVIGGLGRDLDVPVVIVQHMPPLFTQLLATRLTATTGRKVSEAKDGEPLLPGHIYLAPGDHHMKVVRRGGALTLALDQGPPENSCRPSVDVLFRSVAEHFGERALGVVLTGMGNDGCAGSRIMRAAGAQIFVQDEASSVVWGMPGLIATQDGADRVVPLSAMPDAIVNALVPSNDGDRSGVAQ